MEREEEDENTFSLDWMVSAHAFKRRDRPDESATKNTVRLLDVIQDQRIIVSHERSLRAEFRPVAGSE